MVSHFAVKLELNKGANKMAIFGKGGYDSPENEKRREKKEAVKKKEKKEKQQKINERIEKRAKETDTMLTKDVKGIKDIAKGGKDFIREIKKGAKNVKRAFAPTPAEKKLDDKTKAQYMKLVEKRFKEKTKKAQKEYKARKAGAPDNKPSANSGGVYKAVRREAEKKIKPSSLKSTLSDKKVAKVMTDQVNAMKKQAAKRGAKETKEEGIGNFKVGGPIMDRNYLKGK